MGILRQHNSANSKIKNNYYLTGNPFGNNPNITDKITDGMGGQTVAGSATKTTSAQLKSGEIAYKLGSALGQKIGTDNSPVIGGNKVYYGYTSCSDNATKVYTNTSTTITKPAHSWLNGTCSSCKKSCQHSWSNSTCTICKQVCQHNWDNGTCSVCKEACDHNWKNSTCTICSKVCNEHNWDNGNCLICDKICEHSWLNGTCSVCKKVCEHTYENGFCKECDNYQPETLTTDKYDVTGDGVKDTVYEISNGGQFYWFSAVIYNGYGNTKTDSSANAVLTNNIWVNKDVIVNGALNPNSEIVARFCSLTIAKSIYNGTFDGQNHTISGLYFTNKYDYAPSLFRVLSENALVKNVGVVNSYYWSHEGRNGVISYTNYGTIDNSWSDCIVFNSGVTGAMAGENYGVVRNCRNYSVFNTSDSQKYGCYGGIVGRNCGGFVKNCINYGTINASYRVGGIVGYNEGIIRN